MELIFPTKGIAVISLIAANFSYQQCVKLLKMKGVKQVGVLASITRSRGKKPFVLSEYDIKLLEAKVGIRARGRHLSEMRPTKTKKLRTYEVVISLGNESI